MVAQVVAHLPGLFGGLHEELAALALLRGLYLQKFFIKHQLLLQSYLPAQTLQRLQQNIVGHHHADQQTDPEKEKFPAFRAVLPVGVGEQNGHHGEQTRHQPDHPPQPGGIGLVDLSHGRSTHPKQQRQGDCA